MCGEGRTAGVPCAVVGVGVGWLLWRWMYPCITPSMPIHPDVRQVARITTANSVENAVTLAVPDIE